TTEAPAATTEAPVANTTTTPKSATISGGKYTLSGSTASYTKPVSANRTSVSIPATIKVNGKKYKVTSIASNAFKNSKKLKSVVIGNNVTSIGANAFYKCQKLTKVTVGTRVKTINKQAFAKCGKLKTISIKSTVLKTVKSKVFSGIYKKAVIKVPSKKLSAYKKLLKGKGQAKTVKIKK
ncbi:MAG: leucine-rich repeat domain-containing protein, partial [Lachnospiraceae bacterium]|nr:leucine-rich repeat domain-containing protein [Lachnospiraceae bacterium]